MDRFDLLYIQLNCLAMPPLMGKCYATQYGEIFALVVFNINASLLGGQNSEV